MHLLKVFFGTLPHNKTCLPITGKGKQGHCCDAQHESVHGLETSSTPLYYGFYTVKGDL